MRKLRLRLDDLRVDTFQTTAVRREGDRVRRAVHLQHAVHLPGLPHLLCELQRNLRRQLQWNLRRIVQLRRRGHGLRRHLLRHLRGKLRELPIQLRRHVLVRQWRVRHVLSS